MYNERIRFTANALKMFQKFILSVPVQLNAILLRSIDSYAELKMHPLVFSVKHFSFVNASKTKGINRLKLSVKVLCDQKV